MTIGLIDGDIFAYRCAAVSQNDPLEIAISRLDSLLHETFASIGANGKVICLSCPRESNFRTKIYPFYKANRSQAPPLHLKACKEFLLREWDAGLEDGLEADDLLGIAMKEYGDEAICISIDKDLLQIPGTHYNFVKKEFIEVNNEEAIYNFYFQLLMGDATDNIPGCKGIGKAKAAKALQYCESEEDMFRVVREKYNNDDEMYLNGVLLWIKRERDKTWQPSTGLDLLSPEMVQKYESMTQTTMDQYMELITQENSTDGFQHLGI